MATIILVDHAQISLRFKPLTATRSVAQLKRAYFTIQDRWSQIASTTVQLLDTHLHFNSALFVYSHVIPNPSLYNAIRALQIGECLMHNGNCLAWNGLYNTNPDDLKPVEYKFEIQILKDPMDLINQLHNCIIEDIDVLKTQIRSETAPPQVTVIGDPKLLVIESGAILSACFINTQNGPVYISSEAQVMEGAMIRGPFIMGQHAELKMGAKIYGPTAIGAWCKIGGELNQCLFQDYSNKAHDGFLGQSLIGSWCNMGADTNCSNLKNNYASVKQYRYDSQTFEDTGAQFAGIIMGDHSKTGINTMLNTGTVLGIATHVFGSGFPPQFVPDFTWYNGKTSEPYTWSKFIETAQRVMDRRNQTLSATYLDALQNIYRQCHSIS